VSIQRFTGSNSREAMQRVRAALGEDALILANRSAGDGVEILAISESQAADLTGSPATPPPAGGEEMVRQLLHEMRDMRETFRRDRDKPAGADSPREVLRRTLAGAGFRAQLCGELLAALPPELSDGNAGEGPVRDWLGRQLTGRLPAAAPGILARSGAIALVGPTGVGKTTTAAKLAAHYAMARGPERVALVAADSYRIGARDQLRIYADLIGVDLHLLEEGESLANLSGALAGKSLVIVDTAGMGQRDPRLADQLRKLRGGLPVRPVLLLNAASQAETLDEVVTIYRHTARAAGMSLDDAIIGKRDEAPRLGPVLDTLIRHGLTPHFVCHGQRVPEDIAPARAGELVADALATHDPAEAVFQPGRADARWVSQLLAQGRALGAALAILRRHAPGFPLLERAWTWLGLPADEQRRRLAGVDLAAAGAAALCWQGSGARAEAVQGLDGAGLPLACAFQPMPGRDALRDVLAEGGARFGDGAHLLRALPDAAAWYWLEDGGRRWLACARGNARVWHRGHCRPLSDCWESAGSARSGAVRHRGRPAQLRLRRLPVAAPLSGRGHPACTLFLDAWFGELFHRDSGAPLARRYWLLPAGTDESIASDLVLAQLHCDQLGALAGRARALLRGPSAGEPEGGAIGLVAAGLAALACRLDCDESDWALDARGQLLGLISGGRRRNARTLLQALVNLFSACDALRELGAPALEP